MRRDETIFGPDPSDGEIVRYLWLIAGEYEDLRRLGDLCDAVQEIAEVADLYTQGQPQGVERRDE